MSARVWAAMLKPGTAGETFGVVFRGAEAIAGLEGWPLPLRAHPEGEGPAAKAKALPGFGGTGFSTQTSALASPAPLRMLGRSLRGPPSVYFPMGRFCSADSIRGDLFCLFA